MYDIYDYITSKYQQSSTSDLISLSSAALTLIAIYFAIRAIHVAQDQMSLSVFIEINKDIKNNFYNFLHSENTKSKYYIYELLNSFEASAMFVNYVSNIKIKKELCIFVADTFAAFENHLHETGGMDTYKSQEDNFEHLKKFIAQNKHRIDDTKRKLQPNPTEVVDTRDERGHDAVAG